MVISDSSRIQAILHCIFMWNILLCVCEVCLFILATPKV